MVFFYVVEGRGRVQKSGGPGLEIPRVLGSIDLLSMLAGACVAGTQCVQVLLEQRHVDLVGRRELPSRQLLETLEIVPAEGRRARPGLHANLIQLAIEAMVPEVGGVYRRESRRAIEVAPGESPETIVEGEIFGRLHLHRAGATEKDDGNG